MDLAKLIADQNYDNEQMMKNTKIEYRYINRKQMLPMIHSRLQKFLPEIFGDTKYKILDLSAGNGNAIEIANYYGNECIGTDYERTKETWSKEKDTDIYPGINNLKKIDSKNVLKLDINGDNIIFSIDGELPNIASYQSAGVIINPGADYLNVNNYNEFVLSVDVEANNNKTIGKRLKFYNGFEYVVFKGPLTNKSQNMSITTRFNPKNFINKNRIGIQDSEPGISVKITRIELLFRHNGNIPNNELVKVLNDTWLYKPIIDAQQLRVIPYDGANIPYPFQDNEFDIVMCCGALSHHTSDCTRYVTLLKEFCRMAKKSVFIMLNLITTYESPEDRMKAIYEFKNFNYNGFKLSSCKGDQYFKFDC